MRARFFIAGWHGRSAGKTHCRLLSRRTLGHSSLRWGLEDSFGRWAPGFHRLTSDSQLRCGPFAFLQTHNDPLSRCFFRKSTQAY
jgi:hypothetical protein